MDSFHQQLINWVSDYFLTTNEQFFSYIMLRICYIQWDGDVLFVLHQQP
jgi:hypothetical protein